MVSIWSISCQTITLCNNIVYCTNSDCLLLGVTMDTRSTVVSSNQPVREGELLRSCDLVYVISDRMI